MPLFPIQIWSHVSKCIVWWYLLSLAQINTKISFHSLPCRPILLPAPQPVCTHLRWHTSHNKHSIGKKWLFLTIPTDKTVCFWFISWGNYWVFWACQTRWRKQDRTGHVQRASSRLNTLMCKKRENFALRPYMALMNGRVFQKWRADFAHWTA